MWTKILTSQAPPVPPPCLISKLLDNFPNLVHRQTHLMDYAHFCNIITTLELTSEYPLNYKGFCYISFFLAVSGPTYFPILGM